ncbi:MAG: TonB-dependent receptor [Bacteroidetes bacterium]|nr:TonB-dependent receptor [Bacteroidota bacterium]
MLPKSLVFLFACLFFTSHVGFSQTVEKDTLNTSNTEKQLEEVVIFGPEKKQQKSLSSPNSITSIDKNQIQNLRIWEINQLRGISPNFNLAHSGDNRNIASIRGIVTTSYDQAVATYIDGVLQFNLDTYIPQLNDIESIEIIRGAQGTFYGRNSMGGIINIITQTPNNKPSLQAGFTMGNLGQKRSSVQYKSALIKNKLFLSASYLLDAKNGFYTNDFTKDAYDKQTQRLANVQLKYLMKNNWSLQADFKNYTVNNKGAFPLNADMESAFKKPFELSQNQTTTMNDQTNNLSLILQHKGKKANITLQSAYQQNYRYYDNTLDADFSPYSIVGIFNNYGKNYNNVKAFTNELRIQSVDSTSNKLKWSTGMFQYTSNSPTRQATVFGKDAGFIGIPDTDFSLIAYNLSKTNGLAGFGHAIYQLSEKFSIQAGMRLDYEQRALTVRSEYEKQPYPAFPILSDTTGQKNYTAFSPKFGLNYAASDNQFIYFSYSRGFRSGGLTNISSDPSQAPLSAFLPEFANMFEVGLKGMNQKRTLQYALAAFFNHVTNIQTPFLVLPDAITITKNAGIMRSSGLEWELTAKPLQGFTVQYNAGLTNATYKTFTAVSNGTQIDLNNKKQIFTPSTTQFISVNYQKKLGKNELWSNVQYLFTGNQYFDFANSIEQKGYGLLHAQIGYKFSKINLSFWARNITNKQYISYAYDFGAVHLGNPRTFGIRLAYRIL